jgi:drug/metabolite transporter (DMT)-like permease
VTQIPLLGEILALGSAVCWAVAIVLFKRLGDRLGPIALNTFKNSFAVVLLLPTMLVFGQTILHPASAMDYGLLLFSGVLGMGVADTFYLMALNRLGAAIWAIANTLYAPLVVVLAMIFLNESLTPMQWVGVTMVLAALVLVGGEKRDGDESGATPRSDSSDNSQQQHGLTRTDWVLGLTFAIIGMLSMAVSIIIAKPVLDRSPVMWATVMRLVGGLLFLVVLIAANRRRGKLFRPLRDPTVLKRMFPAAFVGTYFALMFLQGGLKYTQASVATVLTQVSTLFIFVLAVIFLKEPINARRVIGLVVGLGGAVLITFFGG